MFSRSSSPRTLLFHKFNPAIQCHHAPPPSRILPKNTHTTWPRRRQISNRVFVKKLFKDAYRDSPIMMTVFSVMCVAGAATILYANYTYTTYVVPRWKTYPAAVAFHLRRADYYHYVSFQPKMAHKCYGEAITTANELGMDPFSDEMIDVKFNLVLLLEKTKSYHTAIETMEQIRSDCLHWLELFGDKQGNEAKRSRVLARTIQASAKLGELYSMDDVYDLEAAEEKLMYSVTTVMKEQKRRAEEGVKEGEVPWLNEQEAGSSLEALGDFYHKRNRHYLAAPLYLHALSYISPPNCHSVVLISHETSAPFSIRLSKLNKRNLVNNLAMSLALQNPPPTDSLPQTSPSALLEDAKLWAQKAIDIAAKIKPPGRTSECDEACVVAMSNLGEFARWSGDKSVARKWLEEAHNLSKRVGFEEGINSAEDGLRKLLEVREQDEKIS